MQTAIAALLVLVAGTQPVDKEKLRRSIELPRISMMCGMSLNGNGQIIFPDWTASLSAEIAAAEKALRGGVEDAPRYHALSNLYYRAHDKEKGDGALAKAAALYRGQLTSRPRDGLLLAHYADCLQLSTLQQKDEAEKLLRQAVQLSPAEWECWVLLAGCVEGKAYDGLGYKPSAADPNPLVALPRLAREGKITPEAMAKAQACHAEAMRYLDRAVALAPRESAVFLNRAGTRLSRWLLLELIRLGAGGQTNTTSVAGAWADSAPDLWRAAALKPDDSAVVGIALVYDLLATLTVNQEKGIEVWKSKEAVQRGMAQLEKLAAGADPMTAARASEILGLICMNSGDAANMEKNLARAVRLNPNLDQGWDMRISTLFARNKNEEALTIAKERLKYRDSARNRFILAKVYDAAHQPTEAVRELGAALEREPDDFLCNVSLAAVLMRDGGDLKRAEWLLGRSAQTMRKHPTEEDMMTYTVFWITFLALNGQTDLAREDLRQLTPERRANSRIQALQEMLDPAATGPPSVIPGR